MQNIINWFESFNSSPIAIPIVMGLFVLSGLVFFPITIMIGATSAAFGPAYGFFLSMVGTLLSSAVGYWIGKKIGMPRIKNVFGKKNTWKVHDAINSGGVMGISIIRMLPIAPFGIMNVLYGVNNVPFSSYMIGTFLGTLPGTLALSFLGNSLLQAFKDPTPQNIFYLTLGVLAWISVVVFSHFMEKKFHGKAA